MSRVEIFEGTTDLGAATLNGDGTFSFAFTEAPGQHAGFRAVATDTSGQQTTAPVNQAITAGITGESYSATVDRFDPATGATLGTSYFKPNGALYFASTVTALPGGGETDTYSGGSFFRRKAYASFADSYDAAGALTRHVEYNRDGSHAIAVEADGTRVQALGADTFTDHAASTRFVFDPGDGAETIHGFKAAGRGHDTLDLGSDAGKLAQVLAHATGDGQGNTTLHLGHGDTITLTGVSMAELKQHKGDFTFHA